QQDRRSSRQLQNSSDNRSVFSFVGIVVVAVKQYFIHDIADLVLRGLYQSQAQVFRSKLHAVVVLRDLPFGRENHDCRGVRKLLGFGIVFVLKTSSVCQRIDRTLWSGKKMPP